MEPYHNIYIQQDDLQGSNWDFDRPDPCIADRATYSYHRLHYSTVFHAVFPLSGILAGDDCLRTFIYIVTRHFEVLALDDTSVWNFGIGEVHNSIALQHLISNLLSMLAIVKEINIKIYVYTFTLAISIMNLVQIYDKIWNNPKIFVPLSSY